MGINDDNYYYPDLIRGMLVDPQKNMGIDVAVYTGSTTGTTRNNQVCSAYTPITWQVDRKCHLISASAFDKMCADMLQMRDDMSGDIHPHGSRQLVWKNLTANNQRDILRAKPFESSAWTCFQHEFFFSWPSPLYSFLLRRRLGTASCGCL